MHTYAIGDIHGHIGLLQEVHSWIARDSAHYGAAPIVHVGDLVDRGPDSHGVVEYLRAGVQAGHNWVVLKGNHDRMFTKYLANMNDQDEGLRADLSYLHPRIGGGTTLASYGVKNASDRPLAPVHADAVAAVPMDHRLFLETLPTSFVRGGAIFVHAGIRPGIALEKQSETDLLWIRKEFLEDTRDHGALIVHGHTAIERPMYYGNRVNTDSSAAYGGPLSAVVIAGADVYHLTAAGRKRIISD